MRKQQELFAQEAAERKAEADGAMKEQMEKFNKMMERQKRTWRRTSQRKSKEQQEPEDALADPKGRSNPAAGVAREVSKRSVAFCSR